MQCDQARVLCPQRPWRSELGDPVQGCSLSVATSDAVESTSATDTAHPTEAVAETPMLPDPPNRLLSKSASKTQDVTPVAAASHPAAISTNFAAAATIGAITSDVARAASDARHATSLSITSTADTDATFDATDAFDRAQGS